MIEETLYILYAVLFILDAVIVTYIIKRFGLY